MANLVSSLLSVAWQVPLLLVYDTLSWEKYIYWAIGIIVLLLFLKKFESQIENTSDPRYISLAFVYFNLAVFLPNLPTLFARIFIFLFSLYTLIVVSRSLNKISTVVIDQTKWIVIVLCLIMNLSIAGELNEPSFFFKTIFFFNFTAVSFFCVMEIDRVKTYSIKTLLLIPSLVLVMGVYDIAKLYSIERKMFLEYNKGYHKNATGFLLQYQKNNWPGFRLEDSSFFSTLAASALIDQPELAERIVGIQKKHGQVISIPLQLSIADAFTERGNIGKAQALYKQLSIDIKDPIVVFEHIAQKKNSKIKGLSLLNCALDDCGLARWTTNSNDASQGEIEKLPKGIKVSVNYPEPAQGQEVYDYWSIRTTLKKSRIDYGIKLVLQSYIDCDVRLIGDVNGDNTSGVFASKKTRLLSNMPSEINIFPVNASHKLMGSNAPIITHIGFDTYGRDVDLWLQDVKLFTKDE